MHLNSINAPYLPAILVTALGIKCSLVRISAAVGNLPCFPTFFFNDPLSNLKFLIFLYICLFVCLLFVTLIIITGEPVHTASKERMAPKLMFSCECAHQLSITDSKVKSAMFSPLHSATDVCAIFAT